MSDEPTPKNPGLGGSYVVKPDGELELRERTKPADDTAAQPETAPVPAEAAGPMKRSILRRPVPHTTENQED